MRVSLIVLGIIFMVIGAVAYYIPTQTASASTTTIQEGGSVNARTSYATITVPQAWALASASIGAILFIFGVALPGPKDPTIINKITRKYYTPRPKAKTRTVITTSSAPITAKIPRVRKWTRTVEQVNQ